MIAKRLLIMLALFVFLCTAGAGEAAKKEAKARLPKGWQTDVEYRVWLIGKGLEVRPQTWRKFIRERKWAKNRGKLDKNMVWFYNNVNQVVLFGTDLTGKITEFVFPQD